ncbi:histidine kinase [Clostridium sp. LY3-2]|uniref:sensor histidine kinase n=1 Tax=Clostridium sp. LY3-2 TaxID=2942482 RepID=UPI002152929E|nr:histidine kinase [Clostridium sp. LY3-2]MCR6514099.1 histidine kinase [Clostridium sp. LY3-2]
MNKSNINLIVRFLVLIGIGIFSFENIKKGEIGFLLGYILISISLSLLQNIFKKDRLIIVTLIIISFLACYLGFRLSVLFILEIALENLKGFYKYLITFVLIIVTVFGNFYKEDTYLVSYFGMILIIFNYYINKHYLKFKKLEEDLDHSIKANHRINKKLRDEEELHRQKLYNAKLKERNNLSRKVHDEVGHVIAGSLMRLEAAKVILDEDSLKGRELLDEVTESLRLGMDDIRNTIHMISPNKEEIGVNRVKDLLNEKFNDTNIDVSFIYNSKLEKISLAKWEIIYDSIKELSTNAIKYSKCNKVNVKIEVLNKIVKFMFKDDGFGTSIIKKGYGLSKIEERVLNEGGKLILDGSFGFSAIIIFNIKEV